VYSVCCDDFPIATVAGWMPKTVPPDADIFRIYTCEVEGKIEGKLKKLQKGDITQQHIEINALCWWVITFL